MSSDPRDLLHRAAQAPSTPLDVHRMLRRARQLRRHRAGAGAVMLVALVVPAVVALGELPAGEVHFADPANTPDPATPPADPTDHGCAPLPEPSPAPAQIEPPEPSVTEPALDEEAARVVIDTAPEGVRLSADADASPTPYELVFDDPAGGVIRVGVLSDDGDGTRAIRNGAVGPDDVTTIEQWPSGVCAAVREDFRQIVFVAGGTFVNMTDDYLSPDLGPAFIDVDERREWGQRIAAALTAPSPGDDDLDSVDADEAPVTVELDKSSITPGESITATMTHTGGPQLHTGAGFNLERHHDGAWQRYETANAQLRGPVRRLDSGRPLSDWIDTSELVAGRYRFTKVFSTADGEQSLATAQFEVTTP